MLCSFLESQTLHSQTVGREAPVLGKLEHGQAGLIAPGFVLLAQLEEDFYRSNNLPERLRDLFAPINPRRIDEDALELLCERATRLILESYLLEDVIAQLGLALKNAGVGAGLHLRRELQTTSELGEGKRGALLALKRLWARDWAFDAVLERLDEAGSVALDAHPSLVFAGPGGEQSRAQSQLLSQVLGQPVMARVWAGQVVGVSF